MRTSAATNALTKLLQFGAAVGLLVGCGPDVRVEEQGDPRILETCTDHCDFHESCGKRKQSCVSDCTEADAMRTDHCLEESLAYVQCLTEGATCEHYDDIFELGGDPERRICRELQSAYSQCLGRHRPAINEELDK